MTTEQSSASTFEDIPCLRPYAEKIRIHMARRPEKSVRAHRVNFLAFARWAEEVEHRAKLQGRPRTVLKMPIEPSDLAAYAEWLDTDRELALSTVRTYMASLGSLHTAANLFNPVGSDEVKAVLVDLRNKHSEDELRSARALTDAELERIFSVLPNPRRARGRQIESFAWAQTRANVDKALLLSMIEAGMRRSEASDLTWSKIRQREDGSGMVLLPVNWGTERYLWVRVSEECVQALMAIKPEGAPDGSNVFNLSGSQVNRRLKRMCEEVGIDSKDISGYTPRATLNRLLAEMKAPVDAIKAQLRLKPPETMAAYMHTDDDMQPIPVYGPL